MSKTCKRLLIAAVLCLLLCGSATGETVFMTDIDSALTSPSGAYRWLDVANNEYATLYRMTYNYTQATVELNYETLATTLRGTLTATNLKPNFAYQLKVVGAAGTETNERLGLAGRWWEQSWTGLSWTTGWNLNNKGDGSSPNPNDLTYFTRRNIVNETSPTGLQYLYSGYVVMDYFITDSTGAASFSFQADSSYHVLWKTSQRIPTPSDGAVKVAAFDPDPASPAYYDLHYGASSVGVFGEWERLPIGGVFLRPGAYACQMILTEESFHGIGISYAGAWAAAMGTGLSFTIGMTPGEWLVSGDANGDCSVNILDMLFVRNRLGQDTASGDNWQADVNEDAGINILDMIFVRNALNTSCY
jgi:hypothetical protein